MSKLHQRRQQLEKLKCSKQEHSHFKTIVEVIGDSDLIEIDFDELSELLGLSFEDVEDTLQYMEDLALIEVDWINQLLY